MGRQLFMNMRWISYGCFFIFLACFLAGCNPRFNFDYPAPSAKAQGAIIGAASGAAIGTLASGSGAGTIIGGVVGGAIGTAVGDNVGRHQSVPDQLLAHRIQIIQVGDEIKIIVPVDDYFITDSPCINPHYYPVLNNLALYLRGIPKASVKVSGYTDNTASEERSLALSRGQARSMADYLWRQDIDVRLIYPVGYGANFPVAHNQRMEGRAQNRRIEITFWRISHDDEF